ncbi:MAG: histidine kinase dimerization/phospho-acceptor domain-containing protein, partial [Actinomycetota bacterium]|nr:histidine kinase dimerization/phospho-acceptor domain-containing protein [Actinomycetota bacterium]
MTIVLVLLVLVLGSGLAASWARWHLWKRDVGRRMNRVVLQLDPTPVPDDLSLPDLLGRLEAGAERVTIDTHLVQEEQHRLQLALDELPVGIVMADQDGSMIVRNPIAEQFLAARHAAALVGAAVNDLLEGAAKGRVGERSVELHGPPARVIVVKAHPLFAAQRPMGAVAIIEDHTDGVRVDRIRRDLVTNLSHELRTPVGAIALLSDTLGSENDPKVRKRLVERIEFEAERVGHIIDDLLELSRVELSGSPRQDLVDAEALLAEVADQLAPDAEARDIKILRLPAAAALRVVGDRGQLLRALGNLVENAIKYSEPDGTVELAAMQSGSNVDIVIRDEGIGIPA